MADYISREAFLAAKRKQYCENCDRRKGMKNGKIKMLYAIGGAPCRSCGIGDMLDEVEDYPAADGRPVVHGKWEYVSFMTVRCSNCKEIFYELGGDNFCPNCGADMREATK